MDFLKKIQQLWTNLNWTSCKSVPVAVEDMNEMELISLFSVYCHST
jgi:hypothetical protein